MIARPRHIAPIAAALLAALVVLGATSAGAQPAGPTAAAPPALDGPGGPSGLLTAPDAAPHVAEPGHAPFISIELGGGGADQGLSPILKIVLLFVALTFVPALFLVMTSFTRIIVVLSLLRQGMGVAQLPPNRVLVALALFLTAFTMAPTFNRVYDEAFVPYDKGEMSEIQALDAAMSPLRTFMLGHTREADLMLFVEIRGNNRPATAEEVPTLTLVPAFILSELKTAFQMGALLFLPFLVIDIVVASILMSMGMMMLPPATIALPIKIIVFVAVDGWGLVIRSLAESLTG